MSTSTQKHFSYVSLALILFSVIGLLWAKLGLVLLPVLVLVCVGHAIYSSTLNLLSAKTLWSPLKVHNLAKAMAFGFTGIGLVALGFVLSSVGGIIIEQITQQVPLLAGDINKVITQFSVFSSIGIKPLEPGSIETLFASYAKTNASNLLALTGHGLKSGFLLLLAVIIAFSVLSQILDGQRPNVAKTRYPFVQELLYQASLFKRCFGNFMAAQAYVAIWNTLCTSVFIFLVLPLFDVDLPFKALLIGLTFLLSFVPALGNIVCNTLMAVVCAASGAAIALLAIVYLILAHKAEYLINAKVLGKMQDVSVAEMLAFLVVGETLFGLFGLILLPIAYLYLRQAVNDRQLLRTGEEQSAKAKN